MPVLNRESVLKSNDLPRKEVEVPEWGGSVFVRTLTGRERDEYEQSMIVRKGRKAELNLANARARLVALSVCDEQGNPIFTPHDIDVLGRKSGKALDRVFAVAQELSGLSDQDVEELAGN